MCGRFVTLSDQLSWAEYQELLKLPTWEGAWPDGGVAYPGSSQLVVVSSPEGQSWSMARWGWYRNKSKQTGSQYNTRSESLLTYYPELAESNRAIVPFHGFLEGKKSKLGDHVFRAGHQGPACAAAVWKALPDGTPAFSILTAPASSSVRPYHHRMPIVLDPSGAQAWLGSGWEKCLEAPREEFEAVAYAA